MIFELLDGLSLAFPIILFIALNILGLHCLNFSEFDLGVFACWTSSVLALHHGGLIYYGLEELAVLFGGVFFVGDGLSIHKHFR
jgi:hypothetical protein